MICPMVLKVLLDVWRERKVSILRKRAYVEREPDSSLGGLGALPPPVLRSSSSLARVISGFFGSAVSPLVLPFSAASSLRTEIPNYRTSLPKDDLYALLNMSFGLNRSAFIS